MSLPTRMRAAVARKFGPPESLRIEELPVPVPGAGEVLVRVAACGLNSWDVDLLTGTFQGRLGNPVRPAHEVLGADVAGTVAALGPGMGAFKVGDRVFGDVSWSHWGGLADYVRVKAEVLATMPEGLGFVAAAAMPQAGLLAVQGLAMAGGIKPGQKVLINGAGGGVGSFAVQMASRAGADVTGVDRVEKLDFIRQAGAGQALDYMWSDFTRGGTEYDLVLDPVARHPVNRIVVALAPGGTYAVIGGTTGTLLKTVSAAPFVRLVSGKRLALVILKPDVAGLTDLAGEALAGRIVPRVDHVYALDAVAAAFRRLKDGQALGKLVIGLTDELFDD